MFRQIKPNPPVKYGKKIVVSDKGPLNNQKTQFEYDLLQLKILNDNI
jgi:hypothetical protein